jgi:hypothetical protein
MPKAFRPEDFKPVYEWEDGTRIEKCRALYDQRTRRIVVQFLGKTLTSRNGLDYISWAINNAAFEKIKTAANPRIFIMLEIDPEEDWEDVQDDDRMLSKKEFMTLVTQFARQFPGGDYRTFGEAALRDFHDNPEGNPQRAIWR